MSEKFAYEGYGQLELNNVAFRRDGRIEAQCALSTADFTDKAPAENGMLLAVDKANNVIKKPVDGTLPVALNYTTEHMYDERHPGLKNFKLAPSDGFYPRMGYLSVGDLFTTNCLCYDSSAYTDASALDSALAACGTTAVYGGQDASGRICLKSTVPTVGPKMKVVKYYTMPDGQKAVKLQVIG